ncbi:MAG TPA: carboxypeptidase regulatory-like domain-containing protein [Candidatus Dormibacteraeota bacterium]|nr:carboxypeptidase regulatory-like domain-containing protein [Candidatus Dormibacteraeota bacterium]
MRKPKILVCTSVLLWASAVLFLVTSCYAQGVTASLEGRIVDSSGGSVAKAAVTVSNPATGFSRSAESSDNGDYRLQALPAGDYTVTVELSGFRKQSANLTLQVGQAATLDLTLAPGDVAEQMLVEGSSEVAEPTRTQVSTVITERQIVNLPVNGREFIDFALLSPAVQIGDTTSGNTDVIVEPVTKLSFAGQNIHYNFIAVDGADDVSTASGIQRGTPPQESVQEFRVINTDYSTEFGRAVGGIVNIITRSGSNDWHGSLYEYFRNDKLDAVNLLQASGAHVLRQNQFGGAIGGPIFKDKTFFYSNYEVQRRAESPFYNSAVLANIAAINSVKVNNFKLTPEPTLGSVLRTNNTDNGFIRLDHHVSDKNYVFARYFINDGRLTNQSPLNDGFDLPSGFKNNFYRDQSLAGSLTSVLTPRHINELRLQYARRSFDFPTVTTQPHLEVANTFATGVNRGNPDFYRETRFELVDNFTVNHDKHTFSLGGNYNRVRTTESFPLFYPFEADFANLDAYLGRGDFAESGPAPFVIFFERFQAPNFTEPSINTAVYKGSSFTSAIRNQAQGILVHTYNGLYFQDKWRATDRLTLNGGLRWEWETWPSGVLNTQWKNFDPRIGLAYALGTKRNFVIRSGFGLFHGTIPSPLLACQIPSCGGTLGKYPGRPSEDTLNAVTRLFAFASGPGITSFALNQLLTNGKYPDAVPFPNVCFPGEKTLAECGFFGDATIVRFDQNHKNPYGIQASLGLEFEPMPDTSLSISFLHVRGVHLGSFFNVNQPDPSAQVLARDSSGRQGCKNVYFANAAALPVGSPCGHIYPNLKTTALFPGTRDPRWAVYFEATSQWDSVFDGLLVSVNKRLSHNFSYGISYTFSKTLDDGPNPSFVLIPQDSKNLKAERAISADDLRHRFVANGTLSTPNTWNFAARDFLFSTIVTLQSPQYFTKFAGFDANGDVFGNNDRVGIDPRNTFKGDTLKTVDLRLSRSFVIAEKRKLEFIAEAFNLLNSLNVRFFNTAYGAADFCPAGGAAVCGAGPFFREGSPNSLYGSPRSVFNPRQIQLALKFEF